MKKQFAILFFLIQTSLMAFDLEINASYDYFRGLPDGSWNGNSGGVISANFGTDVYRCLGVQVGGSYGLYNWDGRENLVFKNPKTLERQAFVTAGLFFFMNRFKGGLVYDREFANHFGIFAVNMSIDQLRFQTGYTFCREEIGIWGTAYLTKDRKHALGIPVSFRAINQLNGFWTHYFDNCASTTLWAGAPYGNSLRYDHKSAGVFTIGFDLRAPLLERVFVDGHGCYMRARHTSGATQSFNYAANVCIGITYLFGGHCGGHCFHPLSLANNSNFLIDTNLNQ